MTDAPPFPQHIRTDLRQSANETEFRAALSAPV